MPRTGRSVVTLYLISICLLDAAPVGIHNRHRRALSINSPSTDNNDDSFGLTIAVVLSSAVVILFILSGIFVFFCASAKKKASKEAGSGGNTSAISSAGGGARSASCEGGNNNPTAKASKTQSISGVKKEEGKLEHGVVDEKNFKYMGPLVVDSGVKGKVRHATEGEKSESIKEVVFDDEQNLVRFIGSDIEHQQTSRQQTVEIDEGDNTLVLPSQMSRSMEYTTKGKNKVAILRVDRTQDCKSVKPRTGMTKSRKSINRKGVSNNGKVTNKKPMKGSPDRRF